MYDVIGGAVCFCFASFVTLDIYFKCHACAMEVHPDYTFCAHTLARGKKDCMKVKVKALIILFAVILTWQESKEWILGVLMRKFKDH